MLLWLYHLVIDWREARVLNLRFPNVQIWACYKIAGVLRRFNEHNTNQRLARQAQLVDMPAEGDYTISMEKSDE